MYAALVALVLLEVLFELHVPDLQPRLQLSSQRIAVCLQSGRCVPQALHLGLHGPQLPLQSLPDAIQLVAIGPVLLKLLLQLCRQSLHLDKLAVEIVLLELLVQLPLQGLRFVLLLHLGYALAVVISRVVGPVHLVLPALLFRARSGSRNTLSKKSLTLAIVRCLITCAAASMRSKRFTVCGLNCRRCHLAACDRPSKCRSPLSERTRRNLP